MCLYKYHHLVYQYYILQCYTIICVILFKEVLIITFTEVCVCLYVCVCVCERERGGESKYILKYIFIIWLFYNVHYIFTDEQTNTTLLSAIYVQSDLDKWPTTTPKISEH